MDAPLRMQVLGRLCRGFYQCSAAKRLSSAGCHRERCRNNLQKTSRAFSTGTTYNIPASENVAREKFATNVNVPFRCQDDNPLNLSMNQEAFFYRIPKDEFNKVIKYAVNPELIKHAEVFNESCIMVRKPALEMIEYIKHVNLNRPVTRAIFYAPRGNGKSACLCHVMHYCYKDNWLIVHVPFPARYTKSKHVLEPSTFTEGRFDQPHEATKWLTQFLSQNSELLKQLKTHQPYVWTKREQSEEGSTLAEIIDYSLSRNKYSTDCVAILLKEIKLHANEKNVKVLVAIDAVNGLFRKSFMKATDHKPISTEDVTLVQSFRKLLNTDWTNGFVLTTVDTTANDEDERDSYTPRYLLGRRGFEVMDPFIPVYVPKYSQKEILSCLRYYIDRNWLQHENAKTEAGLQEIIFLSDHSPYMLARVCASR